MSEFISLTALKEAVGLTGESDDTVDDGLLRVCIHRASAMVDGYLSTIRPGYVGFSAGSNSRTTIGSNTRRYDGSGDGWLWIDDASSIASVTMDDVALNTTSYESWPYNETVKRALVYVSPTTTLHGLRPEHWSPGTGNIDVVGYWGIPTVPDDVAQVTLALAVLLWRRYQSGDPAPGPAITMGSGLNAGTIQLDPEVMGILEGLWPRWGIIGVWGA